MARYYEQEFEPSSTITRHGRNGMPYAIQNEQRYVPSNADRPRNGSRGDQYTPEQEEDANKQSQRRRIPIACGRCRKRKIRCSGQQGDGGGCQNCKGAGIDNCQFNRVQAQELHFAEPMNSFNNLGTLPMHLPMAHGTHTQYCEAPSTYPMVPLGSSRRMPFRQAALEYPRVYGGQYEYADDMAYNSMYPPPPLHHDAVDIGYGSGNIPPPPPPPQRTFTPGPPLIHKSSSMNFFEPSGSYPQQQQPQQLSQYSGPGQQFALPLRSSNSSGDNHSPYNFQSIAQTLPIPSERGLTLPAPTSRPARYEPQMTFGGSVVPSNASNVALTPAPPQNKTLGTSRLLTDDTYSMSNISTSPDGTITSNSSFGSADTGTSSQSDLYGNGDAWPTGSIHDPSADQASGSQQHHTQLSSQTQMVPTSLNTRRSHNDLQNEMDNFNHNSVAHSANSNHPYSMNNGSVNSLQTGSSTNLNAGNLNDIQESVSGQVTPVPQHPQARKLSHHHSGHFEPLPPTTDPSLRSSIATSSGGGSTLSDSGSIAYFNSSNSVNVHISGGANSRHTSMLSNGQTYTPWDGSPPPNSQQMNMDRILDERVAHRGSVSGVRV